MYQPLTHVSGSLSGPRASNLEDVSSSHTGSYDGSSSAKIWSCRLDELKKIKDQLTSTRPSDLKVVSIVGMGGIGKTTLAKSIYEDVEISFHFHLRAMINISQGYKLRNVLLGILSSIVSVGDEICELENEELGQMLYKNLKGRRFLIVLDDMWNAETWNDFKWFFPNDSNGSRIILTTRLIEVADYIEPNSPPHCMNCLSNEESWRLLHNEVFVGKPCPDDLLEIGQVIAMKCQGLPLAIIVVAGHLSKMDKKQECWADVAKRLDSLLTGKEEKIMDILCLSYNHLPRHLKSCFLYMRIFAKNSEIHVGKLIRWWSALRFLQSEDEADNCLQDLINRNLIRMREKKFDGTAKTCEIHDLLWDLSLREAQKECPSIISPFNFRHSRLPFNLMELIPSSYQYLGDSFEAGYPLSSIFILLTILDIQSEFLVVFPEAITNLVSLRYLELKTAYISRSISKLCNLETLVNRYEGWKDLPEEIWLLRHLRHLQAGRVTLQTPICHNYDLQTLSSVSFGSCSEQVFSKFPNLKRLKIYNIIGEEDGSLSRFLNDLYLHQLEKLNLHFSGGVRKLQQIPWCEFFPQTVKQLTLRGSRLQWEDMNILAKLTNIEVLKLKRDAFVGPIYEQTVEGFPRLKVLLFEDLELEQWIAETIHYPILQHLVLRHCYFLQEIPSCFGEITTLESIELGSCSFSALESVKIIQQERQNMGDDLHVIVSYVAFPHDIENPVEENVRPSPLSGGFRQQVFYPHGPVATQWGIQDPYPTQFMGYDYQRGGPYPSKNPQYPQAQRSSFGPSWYPQPPSTIHGLPQGNYNYGQPHNQEYGQPAPFHRAPVQICGQGWREAQNESHYNFSKIRHCYSTATIDDDDDDDDNMKYVMDITTVSTRFSLLSVLDFQCVSFSLSPETITSSARSRYPEIETSHISLLKKIYLLRNPRFLRVGRFILSRVVVIGSSELVLSVLQTLSTLSFSRIPNIEHLEIFDINGREDGKLFNFLSNLVHVYHLVTLSLKFSTKVRGGLRQISRRNFLPHSVKKLSLSGSHFKWEDMNILAMLPNLEVLQLKNSAFIGPVYKHTVEGFPRLLVLLFEHLDLQEWIAETIHYPSLGVLVLRGCYLLEGIPSCFGKMPTLNFIELVLCSKSVVESAKSIQQEQESLGNYDLQLRIDR